MIETDGKWTQGRGLLTKSFIKSSLMETGSDQERQKVAIGLKKKKKETQQQQPIALNRRIHRLRLLAREGRK